MEYRLGDIVKVNRGASPRPIIEYLDKKGYPWLKISDFKLGERYVYNTKEFIKKEGLTKTRLVTKGTLILTNSATPGIPIFLGKDMCLHDGFLYFSEINEKIIKKEYLYYWFLVNRNYIVNNANGSVFKNLKKEIVENLKLSLPSINVQLKVVKILNNINKKLELNNQINNNLYELGDAIYKQFILDKYDTTSKLSNLYKFQYGKGNNNPSNGGKYPVYGSNGVIGGYDEFNNEDAPVIGHIGANCGSLIFAYGKHYVTYNGIMCNIINRNYRYFGYETLRFLNIKREIRGSSQPFISYDLLNSLDIPLPQNSIVVNIENKLKTIYTSIKNNLDEINTLMQLRDTLLPKLMKGKIDLNELEV